MFSMNISLQFLIEIARQKNRHPLPQIQTKSGLRLPPDRYCLTSTNYKVKAQKKVMCIENMINDFNGMLEYMKISGN